MRRLCQILSIMLCGLPLLLTLPAWATTSWIGGCWGALLLTGLSAVWTTHRLAWTVYGVLAAMLAHHSMYVNTDFGSYANWLVILTLLASGWLIGLTLLPWHESRRVPGLSAGGREPNSRHPSRNPIPFSIWDIGCATALVAMFCWTLPRADIHFDFVCQIAPALIGGLVLSIVALQWAWRDNWTISSLLAVVLCVPVVVMLAMPWSPTVRTFMETMAWIVSGPLSVMAAQFIVVLVWGASVRASLTYFSDPCAVSPANPSRQDRRFRVHLER